MGLVLLRKGSQCFIGSVFTPFDPPASVITGIVNENGCDSEFTSGEYAASPCYL